MNSVKAKQSYDVFVRETTNRIDGVIYRLQHHYNLGGKLNSINRQSKSTQKTFARTRKLQGLGPATLDSSVVKQGGQHVLGSLKAGIEETVMERLRED